MRDKHEMVSQGICRSERVRIVCGLINRLHVCEDNVFKMISYLPIFMYNKDIINLS